MPVARTIRNGRKDVRLQRVAERLGKRLRALRDAHGLTQRAAAAQMGVGPIVLRRLERGAGNPSLAVLVSAARVFRVRLTDLLASG